MRKKILAVLTSVALMVAMFVSLPGVKAWADDDVFVTNNNAAGGVSVWVQALDQAVSSGTILAGSIFVKINDNPAVLNNIANYATVIETNGIETIYRFTKNANFKCTGVTIEFTPGAGGAGEVDGSTVAGPTADQIAWAQYHDHAHNSNDTGFGFIVTTPVSEYSDGWEVYGCPECGYKEYSSPISAFDFFNDVTAERIRAAKPGQTIQIEAGQWISFQKVLIDALKIKADDITVVIRYKYQGKLWTLTIPRGTDYSNVPDDNCVGLVNLGGCLNQEAVAKY